MARGQNQKQHVSSIQPQFPFFLSSHSCPPHDFQTFVLNIVAQIIMDDNLPHLFQLISVVIFTERID
jgi:hypothetical protein